MPRTRAMDTNMSSSDGEMYSNITSQEQEGTNAMFKTILNALNKLTEDVKQEIKQTNEKIEQTNSNLIDRIIESNNNLNEKIEQTNNKIEQSNYNLNENIKQSHNNLSLILDQTNEKIDRTNFELNTKLELTKVEIENKLTEKIDLAQKQTDNKLIFFEQKLTNAFKSQHDEIQRQIDSMTNNFEVKLDLVQYEFKNLEIKSNMTEEKMKSELELVKDKLNIDMENKIQNLERLCSVQNINTTPILDSRFMGLMKSPDLPKFNGLVPNAKKSLDEIKTYFSSISIDYEKQNSWPMVKKMLNLILTDSANFWYKNVVDTLIDWADFENKFLDLYWNDLSKRKLRMALETGKFVSHGKDNLITYFQKKFAIANYIYEDRSEAEKIIIISRHFDENIESAILVQGVTTYVSMIKLLQKFSEQNKVN